MITGAYTIFESLGRGSCEYFELFYRAMDDRKLLSPLYSGLRNTIPAERFLGTKTPQPPPAEQGAIVRLLDWANARLERAIRAKRRVIALLNEQKQAIIHRAVTRGLDPSVPLKNSGIPWLGEIPKHWEVLRAKYLFREVDERSTSGNEELLSVSHITGVTPRSQKNITMFKAESYVGHKLCRPSDLVVNTMWAWMGALGVSSHTGIVSPAYAVYRPRRAEAIVDGYIDGILRTQPYVSNIICSSTGVRSSRLRLYPEEFFRLPIILPPVSEQQRIVHSIATETAQLNTAMMRLEREIELLREYRTRLVADVVTGKLDVSEAAGRLLDEAPPDTVEDDTDLSIDPEPADEEAVI
jgi:type I restriction enzyme S subunit